MQPAGGDQLPSIPHAGDPLPERKPPGVIKIGITETAIYRDLMLTLGLAIGQSRHRQRERVLVTRCDDSPALGLKE